MSTDTTPSTTGTGGLPDPNSYPLTQFAPKLDPFASPVFVRPVTPRLVPQPKVSTSSSDSGASSESSDSVESNQPLVEQRHQPHSETAPDGERVEQLLPGHKRDGWTYGMPVILISAMAILLVLLLLAAIAFAFSIIANVALQRASMRNSQFVWARFDGEMPPISEKEINENEDAGSIYTYPNKTGVLRYWKPSITNYNRIRAQNSGKIHILQEGLYEITAQVTFFKKFVTLYSVRVVFSDLQHTAPSSGTTLVEKRERVIAACYEGPIGLTQSEKLPNGVLYEMHTCSMSLATAIPAGGASIHLEYSTSPLLSEGLTVFYDKAANYIEVLRVGE